MSRRRSAAALGLAVLALATLAGCGEGGEVATTAANLTPPQIEASVETEAAKFLERKGSTLNRSLDRFLDGEIATKLTKGSADCRAGADTASIGNPSQYPFACVVEGSAEGKGLAIGITLGFVGLKLDDRCWRAANERVAVTTGTPAQLTRAEAMRPVNQIAACI